MLTNKRYSPKIVDTLAYVASEDGPISLCHDYRLVLFDYPGVGRSPLRGDVTADQAANDVGAMLDDIQASYRIPTKRVNPVGWSLGTLFALKFVLLSPAARPDRRIGDLELIATRPGGNLDGTTGNNQAACVATLFNTLKTRSIWTEQPDLKQTIDKDLAQLTFPFLGQPPNNKPASGCTASVDRGAGTVDLSVTLDCPKGSICHSTLLDEAVNRDTRPGCSPGASTTASISSSASSPTTGPSATARPPTLTSTPPDAGSRPPRRPTCRRPTAASARPNRTRRTCPSRDIAPSLRRPAGPDARPNAASSDRPRRPGPCRGASSSRPG
jgi:pimeloyl-ACP methyl ester carboxylesterase